MKQILFTAPINNLFLINLNLIEVIGALIVRLAKAYIYALRPPATLDRGFECQSAGCFTAVFWEKSVAN